MASAGSGSGSGSADSAASDSTALPRPNLRGQRGAIAHATLRRPGPSLSAQDLAEVERLVERQARRLSAIG